MEEQFSAISMPGPTNTLLIEGSFEELADELAHYIDEVRKKQSEDAVTIQSEIAPLLDQNQKDEALKRLVTGSTVLNTAPEKGKPTNLPLSTFYFIAKVPPRIHSRLQPPRPPSPPIPQPRQIPSQNLPKPLPANHLLSTSFPRPRPFHPHHNIQHPSPRQRSPLPRLPRPPPRSPRLLLLRRPPPAAKKHRFLDGRLGNRRRRPPQALPLHCRRC